jgi:hypothetical protein
MPIWTDRRELERFGGLSTAQMTNFYDLLGGTLAEEVHGVREATV